MLIDGIEFKLASSTEEIRKAYELVYANYIQKKFCQLNIHHMRIYLFDAIETTRTLIAKKGNEIIATMTLVFDSEVGLPSDGLFHDRLEELRQNKYHLCEISKLATSKELNLENLKILLKLFRLSFLYASQIALSTHFVALVEPRNVGFYEKSYFFKNHSKVRIDSSSDYAESVLLEMPLSLSFLKSKCKKTREKKLYYEHVEDPLLESIIDEIKAIEEKLQRINISFNEPRKLKTLALTKEEKQFLEFKYFIVEYNLEQISQNSKIRSNQGEYLEAASSYEKLIKTLPIWAFRDEKRKIYFQLCEFYFTLGVYDKVKETAQHLYNDINLNSKVIALSFLALYYYFNNNESEAFRQITLAENIIFENEIAALEFMICYQVKAMMLNHKGRYLEAKECIESVLQREVEIPFHKKTYLYTHRN